MALSERRNQALTVIQAQYAERKPIMLAIEVKVMSSLRTNHLLQMMNEPTKREVDVSRAERRMFSLPGRSATGERWQLCVDITSDYGRKLVTLRSAMQASAELY